MGRFWSFQSPVNPSFNFLEQIFALRHPHFFMFTWGQKAYLQLDEVTQGLSECACALGLYAALDRAGGNAGGGHLVVTTQQNWYNYLSFQTNAGRWQSYLFRTLCILQDPWVLFGFDMIIAHEKTQKLVFVTIETKWNVIFFLRNSLKKSCKNNRVHY